MNSSCRWNLTHWHFWQYIIEDVFTEFNWIQTAVIIIIILNKITNDIKCISIAFYLLLLLLLTNNNEFLLLYLIFKT